MVWFGVWLWITTLLQYVPLPIFFAQDNLSFYKVMSDAKGYKHIHYVKDVSHFLIISMVKKQPYNQNECR